MAEYYPNIKKARIESGIKVFELLYWLELTEEDYFRYENGQREIPDHVILQLANFFGTSVDYLVGRTDTKNPCPRKK